jgi:hypothetical protein
MTLHDDYIENLMAWKSLSFPRGEAVALCLAGINTLHFKEPDMFSTMLELLASRRQCSKVDAAKYVINNLVKSDKYHIYPYHELHSVSITEDTCSKLFELWRCQHGS